MKKGVPFSQIFLKSKKYKEKVLDQIDCSQKTLLEIGSGNGSLSLGLAAKVKFLYCLEIDPRLASATNISLAGCINTKVINQDFRKVSLFDFKKKLIIFSSVPYYLSSELIYYLIFYKKVIHKAYLILQSEFAQKLISPPGNAAYGAISCICQYHANIRRIFSIPASAFSPRPKVNSAFLEIDYFQKNPYQAKSEKHLVQIINLAFRQRRKKISGILKQYFSSKQLTYLFDTGLDLSRRPEQLSAEDFCLISNSLFKKND